MSAVAFAAARRLDFDPSEVVVVVVTATGLKAADAIREKLLAQV